MDEKKELVEKIKKRIESMIEELKTEGLPDLYLSNSRDATVTGQCYENLATAFHELNRFLEQFEDTMIEQ